jgi:AAA+ ATPase superfamily predicted ATPase
MAVEEYRWRAVNQFVGREEELARLERWWRASAQSSGINLFGRRRVGKSWLLRRFANQKSAVILVATATTPAQQLALLAEQLESHLGLRPQIQNLDDLFRIIFQFGGSKRVLVVLDELPYLLGSSSTKVRANLSLIQTAIEKYRDGSHTKMIICGSAVAQMEDLQKEESPLHGRFQPLELQPMPFAEARLLMEGSDPVDHFTRFAIAGGMPLYLEMLGKGRLEDAISEAIVDRTAPLFNEPATVLTTELVQPSTYMGILDALATKPADSQDLRMATGLDATSLQPYLRKLEAMKLVRMRRPVGATADARVAKWECCDHFFRFWFRFVKRYQDDLEAGAVAARHVATHVRPQLADHTAIVFEEEVRRWIRGKYPESAMVGAWWGRAMDSERRVGRRTTEEIDVVGLKDRTVVLAGEAKWRNRKTELSVLTDLLNLKIPAMLQSNMKVAKEMKIVICSRGGFDTQLVKTVNTQGNVALVTAAQVLET